ncbi:MAG TPA: hypothetical protein DCZ01_03875 [Elusimicrobia bacterium]|nr:MAG: hypothetical protein A2X37_07875 [Elusimicrobia bacterium GWA2_66_18]OGR70559.1 MAG: hypothetical protein A2X40_04750 [Elusimicrobia bacterium GWC2_65_9]HAZ07666.1 hypothetical protein [Elusimicrobiota bacterium]
MKTPLSARRNRGQVLPIALAILLVLTVLVPLMVFYTQRDSVWAVSQSRNNTAFHLAEAGAEKAYLYMSQSTVTWGSIQAGAAQTNYNFDKSYADINGGTYTISITSGPNLQQATVISVGRDLFKRERRALKVVYANSTYGAVAAYAGRGLQIGNAVNLEWGGAMSPYTVDAAGRNHPQFWSASAITSKDTDPNPPNCDGPACCQWHSYSANIPSPPSIDFDFYRTSAAANMAGGCPAGGTPANSCYYASGAAAANAWKETTTGAAFFEGNLTIDSPGMYHKGDMVVMGNVNLPNGAWGKGNVTMTMPTDAWKHYCNDWAFYRATFDSGAPASFPGLDSTYTSPSACNPAAGCVSTKIAINGMLYVNGNFNNNGGGGGNSDVFGALYAVGSASSTANSSVTLYYNSAASSSLLTTNISLVRVSWQDSMAGWPASLP